MAVKNGLPATDFSRMNREYIKEVAEGSAGSVLPEIAAADEGKFLGVVSGEAAWAEAGGGGESVFVCTGTNVPDDPDGNIILNKTWAEIKAAYDGNNLPIIKYAYSENGETQSLMYTISSIIEYPDNHVSITDNNGTEYFGVSASDYPKTNFNG